MQSIQNAASQAPYHVGIGNHEADYPNQVIFIELCCWLFAKRPFLINSQPFKPPNVNYGDDSLGECGVPYGARFTMPGKPNLIHLI